MSPRERRETVEAAVSQLEAQLLATEIEYAASLPTWNDLIVYAPHAPEGKAARAERNATEQKIKLFRRAIPAVQDRFKDDLAWEAPDGGTSPGA